MVQNVSTTGATFNITVTWDELSCVDRNGLLTGYRINYGTTTFNNVQTVISGTSFTVTGLISLTTYMFRVAAVSGILTGTYSTNVTQRTAAFPKVNVTVSSSGSNPTEGSEYSLTCNASLALTVMNASLTYQWLNNSTIMNGQTSHILAFNPVDRYDNGTYTCKVTISSPLLKSSIMEMGSKSFNVKGS